MHGIQWDLDPALRQIHERLRRDGLDVAWGLGAFRDFSPKKHTTHPLYERIRPISPDGTMSISGIEVQGGDSNPAEAHTMALRAAVGIGQAPFTTGDEPGGFRPGARRLVVLITDGPMEQADPHPTIDEAVETMTAHGVRVVALHAMTENDIAPARRDLDLVARGTGGLAAGPVDCDSDRSPELHRGDPLVCELHGGEGHDVSGFGDALADMARRASW